MFKVLTRNFDLKPVSSAWSLQAQQAENASRYDIAAYAWRRHLQAEPDDLAAQLHYSECLFTLGYAVDARNAFHRVLQDHSSCAAALLRLGQLAMAELRLDDALDFLDRAYATTSADIAIKSEAFVCAENIRGTLVADTIDASAKPRLFFSGPQMGGKSGTSPSKIKLGASEYSYAFAARGFLQAFEQSNVTPTGLNHPEYIADGSRHFNIPTCIHLRFSPPTDPRMVKGAANILVFAWEFDELPRARHWPHPFADRQAMLSRYDEIWMPSRHGRDIIRNLTSSDVRYVPSPVLPGTGARFWSRGQFERDAVRVDPLPTMEFVPLAVFPRCQMQMIAWATRQAKSLGNILAGVGKQSKVFLTIANPHDQRKNMRPLIEAFASYAKRDPNAILLIKTSAHDHTTYNVNNLIFSHQLARKEEVLEAFVSDKIWICNENLDDNDLDELYGLADFYICTPYAEGQNLPLLEAMLRGCIPIAPRHTAMLDYIRDDNAIVIKSRRQRPSDHLRSIYDLVDCEIDNIETADVTTALDAAHALSQEDAARLRAAAIRTVERQFGGDIVKVEWDRLCQTYQPAAQAPSSGGERP